MLCLYPCAHMIFMENTSTLPQWPMPLKRLSPRRGKGVRFTLCYPYNTEIVSIRPLVIKILQQQQQFLWSPTKIGHNTSSFDLDCQNEDGVLVWGINNVEQQGCRYRIAYLSLAVGSLRGLKCEMGLSWLNS